MSITSKMIRQTGLQKQNSNTMINSIAPQDSYHSTLIMDATSRKEMKIGQLPYPKYKSSHKNLMNLGGKPNKP